MDLHLLINLSWINTINNNEFPQIIVWFWFSSNINSRKLRIKMRNNLVINQSWEMCFLYMFLDLLTSTQIAALNYTLEVVYVFVIAQESGVGLSVHFIAALNVQVWHISSLFGHSMIHRARVVFLSPLFYSLSLCNLASGKNNNRLLFADWWEIVQCICICTCHTMMLGKDVE